MEQVYFLYQSGAPASGGAADLPAGMLQTVSPTLFYRYGRYCYTGPVELAGGVPSMDHLPSIMRYLQSIQGTVPYYREYDAIDTASPHKVPLTALGDAVDFIKGELETVEEALADYIETEAWLDSDDASLYFEFETNGSFTCEVRVCVRAS
jgi:hypothetical protein